MRVSFPFFLRVVKKSGYKTVRVMFDRWKEKSEKAQAVLEKLEKMGCGYEGANPSYVVINIPPEVDLLDACDFIESTGLDWEHADPSYDTLYLDDGREEGYKCGGSSSP